MPIDVSTLPSIYTDPNTGEMYNVYGSPQEYAQSDDDKAGAIPDANMDYALWTEKTVGGWSTVGVPAPGARAPGAKIGVLRAYHHTTDVNDIDSYEQAFEDVMGRPAPGAFPLFAAIVLVIAAMVVWAAYNIFIHLINKDTEVSITPIVDENGEETDWVLVCKGESCQYFNRATGETNPGPSTDSILSKFLMPLVVVAVVGVGAYAAVKVIGAMGKPRSV